MRNGVLDCLRRAGAQAEIAGDDPVLAQGLLELGSSLVHSVRGFDDEGSVLLEQAASIAQEVADHHTAVAALRERGYADALAGRRMEAQRHLDQAGVLADGDDALRAGVRAVAAFNLSDWGRHDDAIAAYDEAIEAARCAGDQRREAWALGLGGWTMHLAGRGQESTGWLSASLDLVHDLGWASFEPWPVTVLAEAELATSRGDDAPRDLERWFAMSCQLDDPCWEGASGRVLACITPDTGITSWRCGGSSKRARAASGSPTAGPACSARYCSKKPRSGRTAATRPAQAPPLGRASPWRRGRNSTGSSPAPWTSCPAVAADRRRRSARAAATAATERRRVGTRAAGPSRARAGRPLRGNGSTLPEMTATDAPPIDLLDPAWWADLDRVHEFFTWARREAPVYRDANGYWIVTRHADIVDVERRSDVFSSRGSYRANIAMEESNTIALDDPEHLGQRRLVSRRFTPRAVQAQTAFLASRIDELIAAVSDQGRLEVVVDLAAQLPSRLTAELLGFPEERWPDIKSWSERLMRTDAITLDNDAMVGMMNAIMEFNPVLQGIAAERGRCPADDLVSVWVGAGMDALTLMHETGLYIAGGAETTRTVIGRGLGVLADHPDQWEAAAHDPALVPGLVEEVIRWVTPLNNMFRRVLRDDHIGGQPVREGDRVMLAYPSANRDEAVFHDPFRFDIRRSPNPHLAFGQGTHFCVGANLARLELRLLFAALTRRWTNLRPLAPPDLEPNIFATAVRRFEVAFDLR